MTKRKQWRLSTKVLLSQLAVLLVVAVAGEVTVGFLERRVITTTWTEILLLAGATAITLLLGVAATLLLARYLKRSMLGLEFEEFAPMLRSVKRAAASRESLRRVATLVASGAPRAEVFSAVAQEAGRLTEADAARVYVYAPDGSRRPAPTSRRRASA